MKPELSELMKKIDEQILIYKTDSAKAAEKGNAAAARRARGATNELTKLFKEYRKMSIEEIG